MNRLKEGWRYLSNIKKFLDSQSNVVANRNPLLLSQRFGTATDGGNEVDRDFLVKLWVADRKIRNSRGRKLVKRRLDFDPRRFSNSSVDGATATGKVKRILKQPPISQSEFSEPESLEEVKFVFFVFGLLYLFFLLVIMMWSAILA